MPDLSLPDMYVERLSDLASYVRSAARQAVEKWWPEKKWCLGISVPTAFLDGKSPQGGSISSSFTAVTIPGELVRLDIDPAMGGFEFIRDGLVRDLEPSIVGVGKVRVTWHERLKGLVVVLVGNPILQVGEHEQFLRAGQNQSAL